MLYACQTGRTSRNLLGELVSIEQCTQRGPLFTLRVTFALYLFVVTVRTMVPFKDCWISEVLVACFAELQESDMFRSYEVQSYLGHLCCDQTTTGVLLADMYLLLKDRTSERS